MQYKKGYRGRAFEWSTNAAELGSVDAHMQLSALYYGGQGVEKDRGKGIFIIRKKRSYW